MDRDAHNKSVPEGRRAGTPSVPGIRVAWLLLRTARPRQWVKNLVVFLPFVFTAHLLWTPGEVAATVALAGRVVGAFLLLCALSSAVYLVNDYVDRERDRRHPIKRERPIASGRLNPQLALGVAGVVAAGGVILVAWLSTWFGLVAGLYLGLMLAYSFVLKEVLLLDVFSISAGFVLRAVAGAVVLAAPVSPWLYVVTALGALFIGFSKRRAELAAAGERAVEQRSTLDAYTRELLDQYISIVAPATLLAYMLYTFTAEQLPGNNAMMLTIPFVAYGVFRYLYLVHRRELGERPEDVVLADRPLLAAVVLWAATALAVLLLFR